MTYKCYKIVYNEHPRTGKPWTRQTAQDWADEFIFGEHLMDRGMFALEFFQRVHFGCWTRVQEIEVPGGTVYYCPHHDCRRDVQPGEIWDQWSMPMEKRGSRYEDS